MKKKKKKNFNVFMFSQVLLLGLPLVASWMVRSLERN